MDAPPAAMDRPRRRAGLLRASPDLHAAADAHPTPDAHASAIPGPDVHAAPYPYAAPDAYTYAYTHIHTYASPYPLRLALRSPPILRHPPLRCLARGAGKSLSTLIQGYGKLSWPWSTMEAET